MTMSLLDAITFGTDSPLRTVSPWRPGLINGSLFYLVLESPGGRAADLVPNLSKESGAEAELRRQT